MAKNERSVLLLEVYFHLIKQILSIRQNHRSNHRRRHLQHLILNNDVLVHNRNESYRQMFQARHFHHHSHMYYH